MEYMLYTFNEYQGIIAFLSMLSIVVFILSILAVPWMVCKIPEEYFMNYFKGHKRPKPGARMPAAAMLRGGMVFGKNVLGIFFLLLGFLLLFVPGQGLLTLLLGLLLVDFPGKKRVVLRLVGIKKVQTSLNWIRKSKGAKPLRFPGFLL
jgi:hypothetical protein